TSADQGDHTTPRNTGLITGQFYKIALDRSNPLRIVGGLQDNGTWRRNAAVTTWDNLVSSDGQGCILSNSNPLLGWASNQVYGRGNHLWRTNDVAAALGAALSPIPLFTIISPVFPSTESLPFGTDLVSDPQRLSILYTNTNRLWRSTTGGDTWVPLPITTTDASIWNGYVLTAIEIAPSDPKTIMVAKVFDVYRTTDGGTTWVRRNNGLPAFTSVNGLAIDPADSNTAYAALATSGGNNVYFTSDGGANWTQRSSGLPSFPAQVIRVDPTDSTTVYCGTAAGVYRSTNRGLSWTLFGTGLPKVAVYDLRIAEDGTLLRAGTHGRGVWELQIPPTGNNPPAVAITSPSSSTVAKGTVVAFSGTVSEPDADKFTGAWTFPDTWDSSPVTATGATTVSHAFNTPGIWPVSLSARDLFGATASTSVKITVTEAGATCATALPIPAGPFPLTISVNTEAYAATDAAMTDPGDPTLSCYFGFRPLFTAWFTFTAPSSASYQFSTCGSTFYTV
ncbi:MAG: PKD domain-containing protein, partial [Acidobacteriota bacterium]